MLPFVYTFLDHVKNEDIRSVQELHLYKLKLRETQLRCYGHIIMRKADNSPVWMSMDYDDVGK